MSFRKDAAERMGVPRQAGDTPHIPHGLRGKHLCFEGLTDRGLLGILGTLSERKLPIFWVVILGIFGILSKRKTSVLRG